MVCLIWGNRTTFWDCPVVVFWFVSDRNFNDNPLLSVLSVFYGQASAPRLDIFFGGIKSQPVSIFFAMAEPFGAEPGGGFFRQFRTLRR